MFHANAGWILFVLYTLGFWWWAYPKVRKSKR
jgi:cbb3-type cytochrome oxidase subunit 3